VQCIEKYYRYRRRWLKVANIGNHDVIDVKGAGFAPVQWGYAQHTMPESLRMGSIKSLVQFIEVKLGSLDWRFCGKLMSTVVLILLYLL